LLVVAAVVAQHLVGPTETLGLADSIMQQTRQKPLQRALGATQMGLLGLHLVSAAGAAGQVLVPLVARAALVELPQAVVVVGLR
jgi:hypothetical protein